MRGWRMKKRGVEGGLKIKRKQKTIQKLDNGVISVGLMIMKKSLLVEKQKTSDTLLRSATAEHQQRHRT